MKDYPSIPRITSKLELPMFAFDKLDGSNIRIEWTSKRGWYKFGTRTRLLNTADPVFGSVPTLLEDTIGHELEKALKMARYDRAMCFFEFHGPSSFAGVHNLNEQHRLTLIDVAPYNKGILEPDLFLDQFGHLDIPRVLYNGVIDENFIDSVWNSTLQGMTFEGVVCKSKNNKKTKMPIMCKLKSKAWLDKLRTYCNDDEKLFISLQ